MNIKIGKYILTVSLSKYDDIESVIDNIRWYTEEASVTGTKAGSDWKKYLGEDKIKAIKAYRFNSFLTKGKYPDLKSAKEYIEWYAKKIDKPFPSINEMNRAINVVLGNTK